MMGKVRTVRWADVYWLLTVIGIFWTAGVFLRIVPFGECGNPVIACDALSFWNVDGTPYVWEAGTPYRYSPAALWVIRPFQTLPWPAFLALWTALHIVGLLWLRAGWLLVVPGLNEDIVRGNISVFLAVALVLAIRGRGWTWALTLLTKVTPGVVMAWHLVRREWRQLAEGIGLTALIVAIGLLVNPQLWLTWVATLVSGPITYEVGHPLGPLWLRLPLAVTLAAYAARAGRAWLLPIAMIVAVPGLWPQSFALLAAVPRLIGDETSWRRPST